MEIGVKEKTVKVPVYEVGKPGKSAYQIWLDAGNVGTEEDFFSYKYNDNTDYSLTFLTATL